MNLFKKYQCDKCDKKFSKQEELMNHKQIIHGKIHSMIAKNVIEISQIWKT